MQYTKIPSVHKLKKKSASTNPEVHWGKTLTVSAVSGS